MRRKATGQPHGHVLRPKDQGRFGGIRHLVGKSSPIDLYLGICLGPDDFQPVPLFVWVVLYWTSTALSSSPNILAYPTSLSLSPQMALFDWVLGVISRWKQNTLFFLWCFCGWAAFAFATTFGYCVFLTFGPTFDPERS